MDENFKAYHESSHAIVAWVLNEFVFIDNLTLNKELLQNPDSHPDDEGELHIHLKDNDIINREAAYMVIWAGVIGTNIYKDGADVIKSIRTQITSNPIDALDLTGFEGDKEILIKKDLYKIDTLLIKFVINLLINSQIWSVVEKLGERLIAKDDKSLNEAELNSFFEEEPHKSWMAKSRESLLTEFNNPYRIGPIL